VIPIKVTVVDYGIGNLYSVQRALESCGGEVTFATNAKGIDLAERVVLPGVGAFANGMHGLRERGLAGELQRYARADRPLLGICLGMQMLASVSEEFGWHEGLGIVQGRVAAVPKSTVLGKEQKIPHIGWSSLIAPPGISWRGTLLESTEPGTAAYMVHSYQVIPNDISQVLAQCEYGGRQITAAIHARRTFGCQFHPEKSGPAGLRMLANFLRLMPG
jgi:glutamine amidotransferase